jgi:O-antigen/teichoic acid export membrane protein
MNERRRNAFWGILFGYATVGMSLLRNIAFVPIYLHRISLTEYGAWLASGGALALLLINDFGLAGVVTQKASAAMGARQFKTLGSLAGAAMVIGLLLSLLLTGISLLLLPFLHSLDTLSEAQRHTVRVCFVLAIAANALGILGSTAASLMRSMQRSALTGSISLIADVVNIVVTLLALFAGLGLYAIALALLLRSLVSAVAGCAALTLHLRRHIKVHWRVEWRQVRELFADSARFFITSMAMKMQSQANVLMIGFLVSPASAAIYSLTVRAHETVLTLTGQINAALVPSVTHLVGSGNLERFREVTIRVLLTMSALTAFAMTITAGLNHDFLRLWVGASMFGGQAMSIIIALALFVASVGYVAYDGLIALGRFKLVSVVFGFSSVLQILLLIATLRFGLWMAPLVTLLTALLWGGALWAALVKDAGLPRRPLISLSVKVGFVALAGALVTAGITIVYPRPESWVALTAEGTVCLCALAALYWLSSASIRSALRDEAAATVRLFVSGKIAR